MIFGRKGCNERRDYRIKIYFDDNGKALTVSNQLTKTDATKIYEELKQKYSDKGDFMEISYDGDTFFVLKKHITFMRAEKDDC